MNLKIYKIETYGLKNIKKKMTIEFYPKTINVTSKKLSNIKAIYGTNGVGKSAFINSVQLYKNILVNSMFLKQPNEIKTLLKMRNQESNCFYFSVVYGLVNSKKDVFKHEIEISFEDDFPYISYEKLGRINSRTINGEYEPIIEVVNGDVSIKTNKTTKFDELLIDKTKNILKYSSLGSAVLDKNLMKEVMEYIENSPVKEHISTLNSVHYVLLNRVLGDSIVVYLDNMDIHKEYDETFLDNMLNQYFNDKETYKRIIMGPHKDIVSKNNYSDYEKHVEKLYYFLRIFKTDLLGIEIEKQEDKDFYYCNKKLIYKNSKVDSDYESTGIQKMMSIFNSVEAVTRNKIVFIDELDANINGVYLKALLEYLNESKKGQLCFTTHNLYPMHYLYNFTNAIDFIGETGKVVSWTKNGNYRPYKLYPEGMISDSPFNIDSIDFVSVFEADE